MDFLRGRAEAARDAADEASSAAKHKFDNVGQELHAMKDRLEAQAVAFKEEKERMLNQWKEEKRRLITDFIQTKMQSIFDHGMDVAAQTLKEKVKDPYMPEFVKGLCDDAVDSVWPDVKMELKDQILKGISSAQPVFHGDPNCPCSPLAFFRYNLLPYDRGFWRQLRNPIWWIFTLLSCVPKYGVMQIAYFLQFLLIDKSDEYQLFQFIVMFKALQFFTLGIVASCVGSVQYYLCTSRVPQSCAEDAPRESFWTMVIFLVQVIVVFVAFLLMSCSEKKGGFYYQLEQESKQKMQETAGHEGRMSTLEQLAVEDPDVDEKTRFMHSMRYKGDQEMLQESKRGLLKFVVWDLVIFILCVGLICFLAFHNMLDEDATVTESEHNVSDSNWKFIMSLYWVKCFYGYMSFPFLLLKIPLISTIISHARPTGYNPYGNTVTYLGKEEDVPVPWDPERVSRVVQA